MGGECMPRFRLDEERENIFSLYQVLFPELLSSLIGTSIKHLIQEFPLNNRKIDVYGMAGGTNEDVFVEIQLGKADSRHLEKIKGIIDDIEKGSVIWEASSFAGREYFIDEVIEFAKRLNKQLDIFFVQISPSVIPILQELASVYPLDLVTNIPLLTQVRESLKKVREYRNRGDLTEINEAQGSGQLSILGPYFPEPITSRLGANKYILQQIRNKIPHFPGGYRAKSRLDTNALTFGAGHGNIYEISIRDAFSHVKLRIPKKNISTCVQVRQDKILIENRIEYGIYLREERTSYIVDVPVKSCGRPRTEVLDEVVAIFKRFVEFFTSYLFELEKERKVV